MSSVESEFVAFLGKVREGDPSAVNEFIQELTPVVRRAIRRRLGDSLRADADSLDYVQSVWASIFRRPDCLAEIRSPNELLRLLRVIAFNKIRDALRRLYRGERRALRRQYGKIEGRHPASDLPELTDHRQPRPSEVCLARERWGHMVAASPEHLRHIPMMRYQGKSVEEIAESTGLNARTIRRVFERMEDVARNYR